MCAHTAVLVCTSKCEGEGCVCVLMCVSVCVCLCECLCPGCEIYQPMQRREFSLCYVYLVVCQPLRNPARHHRTETNLSLLAEL